MVFALCTALSDEG